MKKNVSIIRWIAVCLLFSACSKKEFNKTQERGMQEETAIRSVPSTNTWIYKVSFPPQARDGAAGFSINGKAYVFGGRNALGELKNDLWEYNPATNSWTERASLPTRKGRMNAVAFSIGNKGYMGTGFNDNDPSSFSLKDFWEYDPATNSWTRKEDLEGNARYSATAFSVNGKGYLLGGNSLDPSIGFYANDMWQYDPATDNWTQKMGIVTTGSSQGRANAFAFSINNKAYVGGGNGPIYGFYSDFWEYDPASEQWTQKADFGGGPISQAASYSSNSTGYVGTGFGSQGGAIYYTTDFWAYDPATNKWTMKADFAGYKRAGAIGFYLNGSGYMGLGFNENYTSTFDLFRYNP